MLLIYVYLFYDIISDGCYHLKDSDSNCTPTLDISAQHDKLAMSMENWQTSE